MYKLMVVDDEPAIAEGLAEMISSTDLPFKEIRIAYSAAEVLEYLREEAIDIFLMDIRMPRMSGLELYEKIREMGLSPKVVYLSGYSDFEYARTALKIGAADYILKPAEDEEVVICLKKTIALIENEHEQMIAIDKAKRMMDESLGYLQGEFFRKILNHSSDIASGTMSKKFKELQIPFNAASKVTGMAIRIDDVDNCFSFDDEPLVRFSIKNMVEEILNWTCSIISFSLGSSLMAFLIQSDEGEGPDLRILKGRLVEVQDVVYRVFKVMVSISLMQESVDWSIWPGKFNKLVTDMRLRLGNGLVIIPVEPAHKGKNAAFSDIMKESFEAMNNKNTADFVKSLERIFKDAERMPERMSNRLASVFMFICSQLMNIAVQYNIEYVLSIEDTEKLSNFYMHKSLSDLKKFLLKVFSDITGAIEAYEKNPTEALVGQVKRYIANHLGEYLSLDILSQKVHVNPSYLSRTFKQITKEQLSSYIARTKMEYAKKLLIEDGLKVQDIAQKTGFDNASYFAKVFRRVYGMSPQEYRIHHCPD